MARIFYSAVDCKLGLPAQSWEALQSLGEQLSNLPAGVDPDLCRWFAAAIKRTSDGKPMSLARELGLVHSGQPKSVDPYELTDRVLEHIRTFGCSINQACEFVAKSFGVSPKTAWYWYGKHKKSAKKK